MRYLILFIGLFLFQTSHSQEKQLSERLSCHISIGQYPASLLVPSFRTFHPGLNTGLLVLWNNSEKHQIFQSFNLGYFYHRDLQKAPHGFSEISYRYRSRKGLGISPLVIGGGYLMSVSDLGSYNWDPEKMSYIKKSTDVLHNWMITLGSSVSVETKWNPFNRHKTTIFLDYRILVHGTFVRETVPMIAYAPIRIGISFPLVKNRGDVNKKN